MHVTACLAGQEKVEVEVGEDCRTVQALREAIVVALPQLCVEGFDVSVGGRALDDDEGVVSLEENVCLDVVPKARDLRIRALREAGREVSEAGLHDAVCQGDASLCALYLDAGVPIDCVGAAGWAPCQTPLFTSCHNGHLEIATLLLDRGAAIDEKRHDGLTPLFISCRRGHLEVATLLLDRGSTAIDEKNREGVSPLFISCRYGYLEIATLLLDRGSTAINHKNLEGMTPLHISCCTGYSEITRLLLDRGSTVDEKNRGGKTPLHLACEFERLEIARLLLDRGSTALYSVPWSKHLYSREFNKFLLGRYRKEIGPQCCVVL